MSPGARLALLSGATPGLSLPLLDLVAGCRGSAPASCPPRPCLPLIISPYLLPASSVAPSLSFSPSSTQPARAPAPGTLPPPLPASPPSGLPLSLVAPGARVTAPRPPRLPRFQAVCRREGSGRGRAGGVAAPLPRRRRPGLGGAGQLPGRPRPFPAQARGAPGRMGCTVSLVCCEALEPGPPCGPQPPGSPPGSSPGPALGRCWEPGGLVRAESRRLLPQVGTAAMGGGSGWWAEPSSPETGKEPSQERARQLLGGGQ